MLTQLHIENIAVIEKADIEFRKGLTVLTGETGARCRTRRKNEP